MLLGEAEETLTTMELDPDTYEQIVKVSLLYLFKLTCYSVFSYLNCLLCRFLLSIFIYNLFHKKLFFYLFLRVLFMFVKFLFYRPPNGKWRWCLSEAIVWSSFLRHFETHKAAHDSWWFVEFIQFQMSFVRSWSNAFFLPVHFFIVTISHFSAFLLLGHHLYETQFLNYTFYQVSQSTLFFNINGKYNQRVFNAFWGLTRIFSVR